MNVLLLGSGGREHALAIAINKSKSLDKLYCAPGNTGTEKLCMNVSLDIYSDELYDFCEKKQISLVVIGPEQPLVDGISDKLREKGIKVFGPNKNAAMIEGDKSFSKALMKKYGIPTARFEVFTKRTHSIALNYLKSTTYPLVVKASGLAAGKGVTICENFDSAKKTLKDTLKMKYLGNQELQWLLKNSSLVKKHLFLLFQTVRILSHFQPHKITKEHWMAIKEKIPVEWEHMLRLNLLILNFWMK